MVSRNDITEVAREAEATYRGCWEVLRQLSNGEWNSGFPEQLVGFQEKLGGQVFALSEFRVVVEREKRRLVARKKSLSASWFKKRMKALARYSEALQELIEIGRRTGDNFAWFFYRRDRRLVKKHLAHEDDGQIPTGTGGIGELEFASQLQVFDGKLVLYHGITTFLRIGDASLFDFAKQRIVALLELKSMQTAADRISISVFQYGGSKAGGTAAELVQAPEFKEWDLCAKQKDRLARQLQRMEDAFAPGADRGRHEVSGDFHVSALEKLARCAKRKLTAYEMAGHGLLLVATRKPGPFSLASRMLAQPPTTESLDRRFGDPTDWLERIRRSGTTEDFLLISELDFGVGDGEFVPPLWRGIDPDFVRDAVLGRFLVLALYNPGFFVDKLRKAGFRVQLGGPAPHLRVSFTDGEVQADFGSMDRVVKSIQEKLFQEEAAVALLTSAVEKGKEKRTGQLIIDIEEHSEGADEVT